MGRSDSSGTALRDLLVFALLLAGIAHIPSTAEHLHEAPYMGRLFVLFTDTSLVLAAFVALRPARWVLTASTAVCAAGIAAYAATRLIPFPMLASDVGNWGEPLGLVSVVAESVVVAVSLAMLRGRAVAPHSPNRLLALARMSRRTQLSGGINHG